MAPSTCTTTTASDTDGTYTADPGTTYDRAYAYDEIGNIDTRTETWGGTSTWNYTYGAGNAGPHAVTSINITGVGAGTHTFGWSERERDDADAEGFDGGVGAVDGDPVLTRQRVGGDDGERGVGEIGDRSEVLRDPGEVGCGPDHNDGGVMHRTVMDAAFVGAAIERRCDLAHLLRRRLGPRRRVVGDGDAAEVVAGEAADADGADDVVFGAPRRRAQPGDDAALEAENVRIGAFDRDRAERLTAWK